MGTKESLIYYKLEVKLLNHTAYPGSNSFLNRRCFMMTVDVDGWWSLLNFYGVAHTISQAEAQVKVEDGIQRLLDLFEKNGVLATFFVTGDMARRHPNSVKEIYKRGHEVACHGLLHLKDEYLGSRMEQRRSIEEATGVIEKITGVQPVGFRAPCLRVNQDTFRVLSENGYLYDSSMIPTFIPGYYGYLQQNFKPYWVPADFSHEKDNCLLELPVSVNPLLRIPMSAAWMRNLGANWVKLGLRLNFCLNYPVVFYVHPRDVLSLPPLRGVPSHIYRNVGNSTLNILDGVLKYAKRHGGFFLRAVEFTKAYQNFA